jgi:hypothetical protein
MPVRHLTLFFGIGAWVEFQLPGPVRGAVKQYGAADDALRPLGEGPRIRSDAAGPEFRPARRRIVTRAPLNRIARSALLVWTLAFACAQAFAEAHWHADTTPDAACLVCGHANTAANAEAPIANVAATRPAIRSPLTRSVRAPLPTVLFAAHRSRAPPIA